ncbi:GNAT family N-acetyltransferase [Pedobacter arcticus]|uniref:GNAT family N-acetyltransferase n=1 Tax=Pedobacter arcticus TaxID=752140 RepID=UPI0002D93FF7|nr:GNAT family N-acetyltransferase [Pedobacter arcticus]
MFTKVIINDNHFTVKGFTISADKALLNLDYVYSFLTQESYWAKNLPFDRFKISIENSDCFGVYHNQKQVGFARIISDKSSFAYLADVFIASDYRKLGLSKWLLQTVLNQPKYKDLRRWMLATADAQELYAQFGFEKLNNPERFMQILKPYSSEN